MGAVWREEAIPIDEEVKIDYNAPVRISPDASEENLPIVYPGRPVTVNDSILKQRIKQGLTGI